MRKGELVVFNVAFFYDCTKICPFYLSAVWLVGFVPMNIWVRSSLIRPPSIKGDRVMISLCPAWCLCWETTTEVLQTSLEAAPRPHLRHFVKFISEIDLQVAKSDAALYHLIAQDYKGLLYWKAAFYFLFEWSIFNHIALIYGWSTFLLSTCEWTRTRHFSVKMLAPQLGAIIASKWNEFAPAISKSVSLCLCAHISYACWLKERSAAVEWEPQQGSGTAD